MIKKGNMLYSIFKMKCPQCHEGDFFVSSPYDFKNSGKVLEKCSECGCEYSKEPGFYYGAMYVSYALGVAFFVASFVLTYLIYPQASVWVYITVIIATVILLSPWLYAMSKIIWANMFIKYKPTKKEE